MRMKLKLLNTVQGLKPMYDEEEFMKNLINF